jgi:hypothetical protein
MRGEFFLCMRSWDQSSRALNASVFPEQEVAVPARGVRSRAGFVGGSDLHKPDPPQPRDTSVRPYPLSTALVGTVMVGIADGSNLQKIVASAPDVEPGRYDPRCHRHPQASGGVGAAVLARGSSLKVLIGEVSVSDGDRLRAFAFERSMHCEVTLCAAIANVQT